MKRKVLFVLIGLFGLVIFCSCKQKPASRLLAIGKVDIVTCTGDDFYVSLKLISRELYENITVVATDASVEYRSSVSDAKKVILDETKEEVYSYSVKLQFLEPAVMKKITLQLDEVIADSGWESWKRCFEPILNSGFQKRKRTFGSLSASGLFERRCFRQAFPNYFESKESDFECY